MAGISELDRDGTCEIKDSPKPEKLVPRREALPFCNFCKEHHPENNNLVKYCKTGPYAPKISDSIGAILEERGSVYGDFLGHAQITQALKEAMHEGLNYEKLPDEIKESLEMIQHKIGRIINGDPFYKDSWTDIIGYARLIEKDLK